MLPSTYFGAKVNNLVIELSQEDKERFLSWKKDPCYELDEEFPHLQQLQAYQQLEWSAKSSERDSNELETYKKAILNAKKFLFGE